MLCNATMYWRYAAFCFWLVQVRLCKKEREKKGGAAYVRETKCRAGAQKVFFRSDIDQYDRCAAGISGAVYFISAADAFGVIVQIHIGDRQSNKLAEYSDHKTEHKIGNDGAANLMFVKELSYADTGMYKKYIEKKAADSHQQKPDQNQRKRDDKIFLHPFHRN